MLLTALSSSSKKRYSRHPSIVTLDNMEATFNVGGKSRCSRFANHLLGDNIFNTVAERKTVGIKLPRSNRRSTKAIRCCWRSNRRSSVGGLRLQHQRADLGHLQHPHGE